MNPLIYLASRSPRRQELLRQIGVPFQLLPSDIDETPWPDEEPKAYVQRMAREKALAANATCIQQKFPPLPILSADTSVVLDNKILGKPENPEQACDMLLALSGKCHEVMTALAISTKEVLSLRLSITKVQIDLLTREQVEAYVATKEPLDKAGAYAIQGRAAVFIESITGSYSGVVGLPLKETADLLSASNLNVWHITKG